MYLLFLEGIRLLISLCRLKKTKCIPCKLFAQHLLLVKNSSSFNTIENDGLKASL